MKVKNLWALPLFAMLFTLAFTVSMRAEVYEDPEGRFSIPLVGDWTPVESDGTYALFELTGFPLNMYIVTVESDDLEASIDTALRQVGVDPAALTETLLSSWDRWSLFYYSLGDGQGVTVLSQVKDGASYVIVATGDEALTTNPPNNVMATIAGFAFAGEEAVLPTTVEGFEAYINTFVGDIPPSLSIVIALGGDVIYANGFGMADGPKGMAATPDTVYQWGSVTKIVTATAIMQLRDQGLIDLDDPVSDYLDYFPAEYPITVRHLLSHSSGLPEPPEFEWVNVRPDGEPLPDPDLVDRTYYEQVTGLMFEPGSDSAYVNPDYVGLGQIVAQVSGQPYIQYVQGNILAPLGMENTDFTYSSEAMIANAAACTVPVAEVEAMIALMDEVRGLGDGADFFRETDDQYAWMNHYNPMAGAGGLVGPPTEAIRFAQMLLNGGEFDGVRILSPESVALMQEAQLAISGAPLAFGLGWHVVADSEHPYIEHDGGGPGIAAKVRLYLNEGFAIVLMSNGTGFDRNEVTDAAANVVMSLLTPPDGNGTDQPVDVQLQAALDAAVQSPETNFPGAMLYVSSPELGTWTGVAGLGNIEMDAAMRPDDKFRAGSIMKPFVSVVILQLVEEGLLSLDDPMPTVLSENVTAKFANSDQITVRMLLNHTSGLPEFVTDVVYAEIAANPTRVWEEDEWLDIAADQVPYFTPGQGWKYSNTDYVLLGLVIEQTTGHSWREEVRERIIEPLNLENTLLPEPGDLSIPGNHARGYHAMNGALVDLTGVDPSMAGAAGGSALVTTTADLARFLNAVLTGELFQSAGTLNEMLAFVDAPDEAGVPYWYGLGMEKYVLPGGIEMIGHSGSTAGFSADVSSIPTLNITVAAAFNIQDLGSLFLDILLPALEILASEVPSEDFSNVFFMPLESGLNLISLPLKPVEPYTARSFAEYIGANVVIKLDEKRGRFVGFTTDAPNDGFEIEGGKGYIVNVKGSKTVAFTGAAWTNQPPVQAAPPATRNSAWAFVVSGSVLDSETMSVKDSHYTVTVKNLRTGDSATEVVEKSGYFAAAWADLTRKSVIETEDIVEITVMDSSGSIVSGPVVSEITLDDVRNATVKVRLRLGDIIPAKSSLLQNYPNPFNPETWIPYQLKDATSISIKIYSASGQLIRTLNLGHQNAGVYISQSKSAYWDGKNEAGEEVASGMYFYTIQAGEFRATKKMVIAK